MASVFPLILPASPSIWLALCETGQAAASTCWRTLFIKAEGVD